MEILHLESREIHTHSPISLAWHRHGHHHPASHVRSPSSRVGLVYAASSGSQAPNIEPVDSPALDDLGGGLYQIAPDGNVPIGTVLSYTVQPPYGHTNIVAMEWTGGSGVLSYFGTPSNEAWVGDKLTDAKPESPTTEVTGEWTTNPNLTFVVDAVQRAYTISIQVVYEDNSTGSATISFDSVAPTVSFNPAPTAGTVNPFSSGLNEVIQDGSAANFPTNAGIYIQAKTTTTEFGGSFMFMQLASSNRTYTDSHGDKYVMPVQGAGPALDNASNPPPDLLGQNSQFVYNAPGYPVWDLYTAPNNPNTQGWEEGVNDSQTHTMGDNPYISFPLSSQSAGVTDNYTTYVMYKPDYNGVVADWVAIGKVVWSWGANAKINNLKWDVVPINSPAPAATAPVTAASDMFPSWTDQTGAIVVRGTRGWLPA